MLEYVILSVNYCFCEHVVFYDCHLNNMFFLFVYTSVCNMADDTTPFACDSSLDNLIKKLENDVTNVIEWFESNYMILNASKCHLLVSGPKNHVEQISIQVGGEVIWESLKEKLLGVTIDKQLTMNSNLSDILQKAGTKVTILGRLAHIMPFARKKLLMSAVILALFSYGPLLCMFCSKTINDKINHLHKRVLQIVYLDYTSSLEELLKKDYSITIHQRNLQLVAVKMFKVLKGLEPELTKEIFELDHGRSKKTFKRPNVNTETYGKNSLRYFGPVVWDDLLPDKYKSIQTIEKFQEEIKGWIPEKCPCSLCKEYLAGVGHIVTFE